MHCPSGLKTHMCGLYAAVIVVVVVVVVVVGGGGGGGGGGCLFTLRPCNVRESISGTDQLSQLHVLTH